MMLKAQLVIIFRRCTVSLSRFLYKVFTAVQANRILKSYLFVVTSAKTRIFWYCIYTNIEYI